MNESHYAEIEVVMLYIEGARTRAEKVAAALRSMGAEEHLIEAVEAARDELDEVNRTLTQGTLFAVPSSQPTL